MDKDKFYLELTEFWNSNMPFNQLLGLKVTRFNRQYSEVQFDWQDKLIGNPLQKILQGGVTATALDLVGGVVAAASMIERLEHLTLANAQQSLAKLSTIDMRTDFLRPGRGKHFIASAKIIRGGSKVVVAQMHLHNEKGEHIAMGTGTYLVA